MSILFGRRRMHTLIAMAGLLLAAGVAIGSGADFTATSANAGNAFTAGSLSMSNSAAPGAIFVSTPPKMRPGDVSSGTVTLSNTGDVPGQFSLTKTATSDPDNLGAALDLSVKEGSTTIYTGKLSAMGMQGLGNWQTAGSHTYTFTVTWPNNAPSSDAADTALMGKACTYRFDWTAIANSTIN